MKHRKNAAPSTRHPHAGKLQSMHAVNLVEAAMLLHSQPTMPVTPGDPDHPGNALADCPPAGGTMP